MFAMSVVLLAAGCSSMRPIASSPPVPRIVMAEPFTASQGYKTLAFPAGEYSPVYEDNGGYYYQAPVKIVRKGAMMSDMCDGGLYVKRGDNQPKRYYLVDNTGHVVFGPINAVIQATPKAEDGKGP
jgi:hypothetical protein